MRVKLNGREIHKLRGYIEVFFGKIGRELRFVAEGGSRGLSGGDQPPPKKPDVDSDEEEDDLGTDNELELEKMRKKYERDNHKESEVAGKSNSAPN